MKHLKSPFIVIGIPVEKKTFYLSEALKHYKYQTYKNFLVVIATTEKFNVTSPFVHIITNKSYAGDVASKRNEVLKIKDADMFVFNDDDVLVPNTYLENIVKFYKKTNYEGFAGPLLTPDSDSLLQKASGAVWESYLGSLGAGLFRSKKMSSRMVVDYPAANIMVRSHVFSKVQGFTSGVYPGEDTKLVVDIMNIYGEGLYYHPDLYVYHHRKPLFKQHLKQIGRYGNQRGQFALAFPSTSFKINYFIPTLALLYSVFIMLVLLLDYRFITISSYILLLPFALYSILLALEVLDISRKRGLQIGVLAGIGIVLTHIYYGICFIYGFTNRLQNRLILILRQRCFLHFL